MSLDFVMQGVPTLWGSFEIKNVRLIQKMLYQYNGLLFSNKINSITVEPTVSSSIVSAIDLVDSGKNIISSPALTKDKLNMVCKR